MKDLPWYDALIVPSLSGLDVSAVQGGLPGEVKVEGTLLSFTGPTKQAAENLRYRFGVAAGVIVPPSVIDIGE